MVMAMDNNQETRPHADTPDGLIRIDPGPQHFHAVRAVLIVEGVALALLGIWGLVVAFHYHGADPTGAVVIGVLRLTVPHAAVLLGTGVLALVATAGRRWGVIFGLVQVIAYGLMFVTSAGAHNSFSNGGDAALHGILAAVGLIVLMWSAGRALDGYTWERKPPTTAAHH
jgi:hypothetical protein